MGGSWRRVMFVAGRQQTKRETLRNVRESGCGEVGWKCRGKYCCRVVAGPGMRPRACVLPASGQLNLTLSLFSRH